MRHHSGPIADLQDAVGASRYVWLFCIDCGHAARKHPWDVARKAGTASFDLAARKCRCTRCGARAVTIVPARMTFEMR